MRRFPALGFPLLAAFAIAPLPARAADSAVEIAFVHPEHFTDAALYGGNSDAARAPALNMLKAELTALAARYLPPGESVKIDFLDVDLAGRYAWWVQPAGIRVLDDVTWPSFKLSYELDGNGAVLRKDTETVSDLDYLTRIDLSNSDPLWREKAMLKDWFRRRFAPPPAAGN